MDYHISSGLAVLIGILVVWDIFWKGMALWRAAQRRQTAWYITLLVLNTAGFLPIVYLLSTNVKTGDHDEQAK